MANPTDQRQVTFISLDGHRYQLAIQQLLDFAGTPIQIMVSDMWTNSTEQHLEKHLPMTSDALSLMFNYIGYRHDGFLPTDAFHAVAFEIYLNMPLVEAAPPPVMLDMNSNDLPQNIIPSGAKPIRLWYDTKPNEQTVKLPKGTVITTVRIYGFHPIYVQRADGIANIEIMKLENDGMMYIQANGAYILKQAYIDYINTQLKLYDLSMSFVKTSLTITAYQL